MQRRQFAKIFGAVAGMLALPRNLHAQTSVPLVYRATLSQAGTNDPTATVHENTLSGEVVWVRNEAGDYAGTLEGAFPTDRTFVQISAMTSGLSLEAAPGAGDVVSYDVQKIDFDDLLYQLKDNHRVAITVIVYPEPDLPAY